MINRSAKRNHPKPTSRRFRLLGLTAALSLSALLFAACDPKHPTGSTASPNTNSTQTTEAPQSSEKDNDALSIENMRYAYANAMVAFLNKDSTKYAVYEKVSDTEEAVTVSGVQIASTAANNWSGLEVKANPYDPDYPEDPGHPGVYSMLFTKTGGTVTISFQDDIAETGEVVPEEILESKDANNLRSAYAMVQASALMQSADDPGITRAGEGPGAYTYTATVEATQTVAGWQTTSIEQIAGTPIGEIPAKVQGESWTVVYDETTNTTTFN